MQPQQQTGQPKKKLRFISANSSWRVLSVSHFRLSAETFPSCLFSYPFVRFNLLLFFINNSSYLCGYDDAICSADVIHNSIAGPIYCHGAADGSMAAWTCKKRRFEKVIRSNSGCKKIRLQFLYTLPGPAWGMDDSPRGRSFTFCLSTSCKMGLENWSLPGGQSSISTRMLEKAVFYSFNLLFSRHHL